MNFLRIFTRNFWRVRRDTSRKILKKEHPLQIPDGTPDRIPEKSGRRPGRTFEGTPEGTPEKIFQEFLVEYQKKAWKSSRWKFFEKYPEETTATFQK